MRIERFHQTWIGRRASTQRFFITFDFYYNRGCHTIVLIPNISDHIF